jgi:hypothetical protein
VSPEKSLDSWLAILANTFFGLFMFMESITLPDLLRVKHVSVFGYSEATRLDKQSHGLWLAALTCAALSSGIGLFKAYAHRAVPETGSGFGAGEDGKSGKGAEPKAKAKAAGEKRKQEREKVARETNRKIAGLSRKLLAEVLDILIPAWSTGLADIDLGTVSIAMFCSTVLTGYAVWERCGQAIDSRRA